MGIGLIEKICIGTIVVGATCFVASALIALEKSFDVIDEYRKELVRTLKTNKESE